MNIPPSDAMRVPVGALRALIESIFRETGVPEQDAVLISDLLIDTDLRGVLSHGTNATPEYARAFLSGSMNPVTQVSVTRDEVSTAVVDGDGGLGHPSTYLAAELAIEKARATGVGAVISCNHGHFGSAGKYTRMAVREDFIGFCVSGHLIGEGGVRPDLPQFNPLGNPPMSFAIPSGEKAPLILDMGTSFFEPEDFHDLFHRIPAAFFKSLGLVGVALLMGGALAGMMDKSYQPESRRYSAAGYGGFIFAMDVGRFVSVDTFKAEMDRSMRYIQDLPPLPGYERFDFPGGQEFDRESIWAEQGIPLSGSHRQGLEDIARELDLTTPW